MLPWESQLESFIVRIIIINTATFNPETVFFSYQIRALFTCNKYHSFNCEKYSGCLNSPKDHNESHHYCSVSKNKIFHAKYIVHKPTWANSQRNGMQTQFMACSCVSCSVTKKQEGYMLLYWVVCNLLANFGKAVPYVLVLLKIDYLDVNNHLYLLFNKVKIPLVSCWWTFLCFGCSEFSTRPYYFCFTSYSPSVLAVMILHS